MRLSLVILGFKLLYYIKPYKYESLSVGVYNPLLKTFSLQMVKSHEEHQTLISSCIDEIHAEFDKIFRLVVEGIKKLLLLDGFKRFY